MTAGKDADICSFREALGFSYNKLFIRVSEYRPVGAAKTEIHWTIVFSNCQRGSLGLVIITRHNNRHAGKHFHQADIFQYLVGGTILTKGNPGVRSADLYILPAIRNALAYLVVNTACGKIGESGCKRDLSPNGQTCSDTHHIGFCNANLYKALRKFFYELLQLQRTGKVSGKGYYIFIFTGGFCNSISKSAPGIFLSGRLYIF